MPETLPDWAWMTIGVVGLVAVALASYLLTRLVLMPLIRQAVGRTSFKWDDVLLDSKLLHRVSLLAPFLVIWLSVETISSLKEGDNFKKLEEVVGQAFWIDPLLKLDHAILIVLLILILSSSLTALNKLYMTFPVSRQRPIKGYLQIANIVGWIFGGVILLAVVTGQEVGYFVTGLGAMTAVLLLIFKDTILSLVASVQLSQNDMIRVGDWIEMPGQNADGDVMDIALHTVKIQNFDKTITTVPTHKLIQEPFRNWRGMSQSGGRRIKRSIAIDMSTVRFLDDDEIERFSKFSPLQKYMASKRDELQAHNDGIATGPDGFGDPRKLTNIGTFRAYVIQYLRAHPRLHQSGMTLLVRQLAPTPKGLPIELYVFSNDTSWVNYEGIQADIFDHLLSMLPEFGLRAFQEPTSGDFRTISGKSG